MDNLITMGIIAVVVIVFVAAIIGMMSKLYRKATPERAFVRTGTGGRKVIMSGGAIVFPVFHEVMPVNMKTFRINISRGKDSALITKDRMRVDVIVDCYVRVKPDSESVVVAAQTMGMKTMRDGDMGEQVEPKVVDAMRAVAAKMTMEQLHEDRADFVQKAKEAADNDLEKNGLELESVSLTAFDQTELEYFNENNAFDAEGMKKLTEKIETARKDRNDIEQNTSVQIEERNLEASQRKLEFGREQEYAEMAQERELATRRAEQQAEIAREQSDRKREAREAEIENERITAQREIEKERDLDSRRIEAERTVEESNIERTKQIEIAENEQRIAVIGKERELEEGKILKEKAVKIAEQERDIEVAMKSEAQSEAQSKANTALALAVRSEEKVVTARDEEIAERTKAIELIKASEEAEKDAIGVRVASEAKKDAAINEAEAITVEAEARAEADRLVISVEKDRFAVEAEGKKAINEAANLLSVDQVGMQVRLQLIKSMPGIIAESVKPMENISDIKIIQVDGLNGSGGGGGKSEVGGTASLADNMANAALAYRAQAPMVDSLLKEIGAEGGDINGLTKALTDSSGSEAGSEEA